MQAVDAGNVNAVDRLLEEQNVDPGMNQNQALRSAHTHGHLNVVDRLLQDDRVDPSANDNELIKEVLQKGRLDLVKRLKQHPKVKKTLKLGMRSRIAWKQFLHFFRRLGSKLKALFTRKQGQ